MKKLLVAACLAAVACGCTSPCGSNTGLDGRHHDIVIESNDKVTDYWIKDRISSGALLLEKAGAKFDGYDVIKCSTDDWSNTYRVRVYGKLVTKRRVCTCD